MTTINWAQRVQRLIDETRNASPDDGGEAAQNDPGEVPAHVMPALCSMAQRLGYRVILGDLPTDCLGLTYSSPDDENTITLRAGMSPASTARVLGHELGHARDYHGYTEEDFERRAIQVLLAGLFGGTTESQQEELACELGTAAFCEAMGIGTRGFLREYVGERLPERPGPEAAAAAAGHAEALWNAVTSAQE